MADLLKAAPLETLVETMRAVFAGHKRIPVDVAIKSAKRLTSSDSTACELEMLRRGLVPLH